VERGYVWDVGNGVLNCASSYGSPTPAKEGVENVPNRDIDDLAAHCLSCPPLMAAARVEGEEQPKRRNCPEFLEEPQSAAKA